jgi:hypothetical protein
MSENKESCDMRRVQNWWELHERDELKVGDFEIYDTVRSKSDLLKIAKSDEDSVTFKVCAMLLPGEHVCVIPLRPVPEAARAYNGGHSWAWNGNSDKPTLDPSVNSKGCWHGYIRAGRMESV